MAFRSKLGSQPGARSSTLDVLLTGAAELAGHVYRGTGREVKALGIAVDAHTFERVALLAAERDDVTNTAEEIIERGWIDLEHDGIRLRIAVEELTHG